MSKPAQAGAEAAFVLGKSELDASPDASDGESSDASDDPSATDDFNKVKVDASDDSATEAEAFDSRPIQT